jgi:hypothetical protein
VPAWSPCRSSGRLLVENPDDEELCHRARTYRRTHLDPLGRLVNTGKIRIAVSRDRGLTFSKAVTITAPGQTGPSNTFIYPSVDAAGTLYIAFASFPVSGRTSTATLYVSHSSDDGQTFAPFVPAATAGVLPATSLPNTNFRDGITENFAASPTHSGHLYLTYEDWNGTKMNVKFTQSTDGGSTYQQQVLATVARSDVASGF